MSKANALGVEPKRSSLSPAAPELGELTKRTHVLASTLMRSITHVASLTSDHEATEKERSDEHETDTKDPYANLVDIRQMHACLQQPKVYLVQLSTSQYSLHVIPCPCNTLLVP